MRKLFAAMTIAAFTFLTFITLGFAADKGGDDGSAVKPWTGFYMGVHAGLTVGDNGASATGFTGLSGVEADAALVGIHGGYDYHLPGTRIVVGGMVDYTYSGMTGGIKVAGITLGEYDISHQLSASGRLGYLLGDRFMVYAMGGYTKAYTSDLKVLGVNVLNMPDLDGWHIGAGSELRLGDHWSISAQYRLTEFENTSIANTVKLDTRDHSARLGVAYRF